MHWGVGIENTAIGVPIRHTGRTLDEFALTEHDRKVTADLELAGSLGSTAIRYGPPWYRINPAPGVFVWEAVDPAIECAAGLGLEVIVDLVHYGVPAWVPGGFIDPGYPDAIAAYGQAFAERYRDVVSHFTPLNEPTITATFCGETGGWPPYLTGERGWTKVTIAVALGIQRTVAAIRAVQPDATIVHVEQSKLIRQPAPELVGAADLSLRRAWLPTDLVVGRVNGSHDMTAWLLERGADERALQELTSNPAELDVLGVNFYPQYSVRDVVLESGVVREVSGGGTAQDLVAVLGRFAARYGRPVAVTETSYDGDDTARVTWMRDSVEAVDAAARAGLDLWGYLWWPLFDFVDWGISMDGYPLEDFLFRLTRDDGRETFETPPPPGAGAGAEDGVEPWLRRMGLWRLGSNGTGLRRIETDAAREFRSIVAAHRAEEAAR